MKLYNLLLIIVFFSVSACNNKHSEKKSIEKTTHLINKDSSIQKIAEKNHALQLFDTLTANFNDSDLVDITLFTKKAVLQIRYATKDNFLDTILYPCAKCLLRYEVLKDLLRAQSEFEADGFTIKLYDCYRPFHVQELMWEKVPIPGLVANPATGSRHNRGSAVDISLTDARGKELDFGTAHDDFSEKAKTFYPDLPDTVKKNRIYLRKVMQKHHFKGINSEWWHFSHTCGTKYKVSDKGFDCD